MGKQQPVIRSTNHVWDPTFIYCPFENEAHPDGYQHNEEILHPRDFPHTYEECTGWVNLVDYLLWLGRRVEKAYIRP